jgi:steroid delta-isomerase
MPGTDVMKAAMQAYVDRFNAGDLEGVLALYADNASAEDPVGTPLHQGKEALRQFYATAIETGGRLELVAPMRGSQGNFAAMAFDVKLNLPSGPATVRVIDVMSFDEVGRIASMRAFWGPDDFVPG